MAKGMHLKLVHYRNSLKNYTDVYGLRPVVKMIRTANEETAVKLLEAYRRHVIHCHEVVLTEDGLVSYILAMLEDMKLLGIRLPRVEPEVEKRLKVK